MARLVISGASGLVWSGSSVDGLKEEREREDTDLLLVPVLCASEVNNQ